MKRRDRGDRRVLTAIVCRLPSGPRPARRPGAARPPRSLRSRRWV